MKIFDTTESLIGSDGTGYITANLSDLVLDDNGLIHGVRAVSIHNDHRKQCWSALKFHWVHGVPKDFEVIAKGKEEVITLQELPNLLDKICTNKDNKVDEGKESF